MFASLVAFFPRAATLALAAAVPFKCACAAHWLPWTTYLQSPMQSPVDSRILCDDDPGVGHAVVLDEKAVRHAGLFVRLVV